MKPLHRVFCSGVAVLLLGAQISLAQDDEPAPFVPGQIPFPGQAPFPGQLPPGQIPIVTGQVQPGQVPGPPPPPPLQGVTPGTVPGPPGTAPGTPGGNETMVPDRVYVAEERELSLIPRNVARWPGAVSLRASEEAFEANTRAKDALINYVRQGGTVFLHTGAARAFGFETVEARPGTNALAGQLFGRARAALPFAAHPLLWDDGRPAMRSANSDPTLLPGVNLVYYELQPGDHLVVGHPAGTPLLQVTDLSTQTTAPLYAAAIAPFGKGYAIFTPDIIDQKRADGALFTRNLMGLMAPTKLTGRSWTGVPAAAIENGVNAPAALRAALAYAVKSSGPVVIPALPALGTAPAPQRPEFFDVPPPRTETAAPEEGATEGGQEPALPPDEIQVMISRGEADSYGAMLDAGGAQASAAIGLLQARLLLARNLGNDATRVVENTADFAPEGEPGSAEISLWRGILLAGAAQVLNQSSAIRATFLADAARDLEAAANGASPPATGAAGGVAGGVASGARVAGIPVTALRAWSVRLAGIARAFSLEPPFVQLMGVGDATITLRGIQADAGLQLTVLAAQKIAESRSPGWHGDREEVIVFPTIQAYTIYRNALGLQGPTVPMPAGVTGDVLGQRIIMCAVPNLPLLGPDQGAIGQPLGGFNTPDLFSRLHSYVLLNALDEGGTGVPIYIQLGLENLIATVVNGEGLNNTNLDLRPFAAAGTLMGPNDFNGVDLDPVRRQLAISQASAMLTYFFDQFGNGAVVETIQRLGSGQNRDDAFTATTEDTEIGFFEGWRLAQFGIPRTGEGEQFPGGPGQFPQAGPQQFPGVPGQIPGF